ncbi:hypothetical protein Tco_1050140, partial [Tanacetum coccineum]
AVECVDERDALANLIANLTLDTEENKTILKKSKQSLTQLTQELKECKTNLDETNSALGEAIRKDNKDKKKQKQSKTDKKWEKTRQRVKNEEIKSRISPIQQERKPKIKVKD